MIELDRYDALKNILVQRNSHSVGVMNILNDYYPAFAKKIFERNPLMEKMAMANFTSMDILIHPICGHCETLAAYCRYAQNRDGTPMLTIDGNHVGVCRCFKCGFETVNPITFIDFCMLELHKRAPETIYTELIYATDAMADRILADAKRLYVSIEEKERFYGGTP